MSDKSADVWSVLWELYLHMNDFSYSFDVQDNFITIIIIFIFAVVMFSNTKIFIRLMPDTLQDENNYCPLTFV